MVRPLQVPHLLLAMNKRQIPRSREPHRLDALEPSGPDTLKFGVVDATDVVANLQPEELPMWR